MIKKRGFRYENFCKRVKAYVGSRNILSCWIRTFLVFFVITFVWIQIVFGNSFWIKNADIKEQPNNSNIDINFVRNFPQHRTLAGKLISIKNDGQYKEQLKNENDAGEIRDNIKQYNEEQNVINGEIYGSLSNDSVVVVIQVHNRIHYLKYLIESLSKAQDINQVLLIFSHDIYENDMNQLIQNITFCKVMQIFLPYSIEANPHEFPGNDPNDCPRDIGKSEALNTNCLGAEHPDKYGHYRESKFTQIKHHWWWKANQVFNHLKIMKAYTGLVVFLEEDHYVVEDFLPMLKLMKEKCVKIEDCFFLGLGNHMKLQRPDIFREAEVVRISPLITNLGLTFNRTTFNKLLGCSKQFCEYDDYNWDWSLNHVVQTCYENTMLKSMIALAPRAFHTGECGTHIHKNNCKVEGTIASIQELLKLIKNKLYPSSISIDKTIENGKKLTENGGWGDKRDHELCINMTKR